MNYLHKNLLVIFLFAIVASSTNANVLPEHLVTEQQQCIQETDSYEQFLQTSAAELIRARGRKPQKAMVEKFATKLKKGFSPSLFQEIKTNYHCFTYTYVVEGTEVDGFYFAKKQTENKASPTIIFNRGGNGRFGENTRFSIIGGQLALAKKGFIVLASNYRKQDEFGGKDVNDVVALVNIAEQLPQVDKNKIGMFGVSRGGHMTYMAVKQLPQIKSIAVWAGVSDLEASIEERPEMERVYKARIPHYATQKQQQLQMRSVIHWLDQLPAKLPIFLLHGDSDKRVHVNQSKRLAKALEANNRSVELKIFEGADHGMRPNRQEALDAVVTWFSKTL